MAKISFKVRMFLLIACAVALGASLPLLLRQRARAVPSSPNANVQKTSARSSGAYGPPRKLANLRYPAVDESSGIVASRSTPGLYWTHNDSGDGPFIYAFDERGQRRGIWRVTGAKARDWEAIAAGPGPESNKPYLYIGDIGDNNERRSEIVVYRVLEPVITAGDAEATKSKPRLTEAAESIRLRYPDGKHDAETLLVHPQTGNLYIVTKQVFGNPHVYEASAPLVAAGLRTLRHVGELRVPGMFGGIITDGAISPDGGRVALCDYLRGYELVLATARADFDTIWAQPLTIIELGKRKQGEAITYRLDGRALLTTSEGSPMPLIENVIR